MPALRSADRTAPITRRRAVIVGSLLIGGLLIGLALVVGAAPLDGWWQSVLIEVGASFLLVAPLAWAEGSLRRSLYELDARLRSSAVGLSAIRNLLPADDRRTAIFDELLAAVTDRAADGEFPSSQIRTLLRGDGDDRTVALAAMVGDPSLADPAAILGAIRRSDSANEQYYALRAASAAWSAHLDAGQRARILAAVDDDDRRRGWIAGDPHRRAIANRLRVAAPPS